MSKQTFLKFLDEHGFLYALHEHEPIYTVEQGRHLHKKIAGAHSKTLFLKDRKNSYFLVSILEYKRLDVKAFSRMYGKGGLSFASEQALLDILHLEPGAVTPFGLFYESAKEVQFILDEDFLQATAVNFHPLQNDSTLSMDVNSFLKFFATIKHPIEMIKIPVLIET